MYCIIAKWLCRNLLKVQYKEKYIVTGLFLHSLFVIVRYVSINTFYISHFRMTCVDLFILL